ncbi:hypothetical protein ACOSQ3_027807 [Xanthoceras sorbifolium]
MHNQVRGSFKSKLFIMASLGTWYRFGSMREKLRIWEEDIAVKESPNGLAMKLSMHLKNQLKRPWINAVVLKVMGKPHTLNYMLKQFGKTKLKQKWSLLGQ